MVPALTLRQRNGKMTKTIETFFSNTEITSLHTHTHTHTSFHFKVLSYRKNAVQFSRSVVSNSLRPMNRIPFHKQENRDSSS